MLGAGPEHPAGKDLAPLGDEPGQELHVLVVDVVDLVRAELADLATPEEVTLPLVLVARPALAAARPAPPAGATGAPSAAARTSAAATEAHRGTSSESGTEGMEPGRGVTGPRAFLFSSSAARRARRRSAFFSSSSTRTVMNLTTPSVTRMRRSTSLTAVALAS